MITLRGKITTVRSADGYKDKIQRISIESAVDGEYWALTTVRNVEGMLLDQRVTITIDSETAIAYREIEPHQYTGNAILGLVNTVVKVEESK